AETLFAPVKLQVASIGGQLVGYPVNFEAGALDAVGDAPGKRAEMRAVEGIGLKALKAQNDAAFPARDRHPPVPDGNAIADDIDHDACIADQPKLVHALAAVLAKSRNVDSHRISPHLTPSGRELYPYSAGQSNVALDLWPITA